MSRASAERVPAGWLPQSAPGTTALERVFGLRPELYADYRAFAALFWSCASLDPALLELCRLRIAALLGCEAELCVRLEPAREGGLDEERIARLARWPTDPVFSGAERACLAYAEQFVLDVHGITDEQAAAVRGYLGDAGLVALTEALALFEGFARFRLMLGVAPETLVLTADGRAVAP